MRRTTLRFAFVVFSALSLVAPALAGGGGGGAPSAKLNAPPGEVRVGQPVKIGFMVLVHGESPFHDVRPRLAALHKETKETLQADARKEPEPGHFSVEATFPLPGTWFWEIVLEDWGATTFPLLEVLTAEGIRVDDPTAALFRPDGVLPAVIVDGGCDALGGRTVPPAGLALTPAEEAPVPLEPTGSAAIAPVRTGLMTVAAPLAELLGAERAIAVAVPVAAAGKAGPVLACGEVGGRMVGEELPVGLQPVDGSALAGVAVLRADGDRTMVRLYLIAVPAGRSAPTGRAAGPAQTVEMRNFAFAPASLEVANGTTVTWTNRDGAHHSVAFDDMVLPDSPVLAQGASFSQTFDEPGPYAYHCGPHPDMRGTIVVE